MQLAMFSSTKTGHIAHIIATALVGQAASQGLVPPDPHKIEDYGHLAIQALVALVTIWATVRKALQRPENVVKAGGGRGGRAGRRGRPCYADDRCRRVGPSQALGGRPRR